MKKLIWLGLFALLFAGCAGFGPTENLAPKFEFANSSRNGVVVFSQLSNQVTTRLFIRPVGGSESATLHTTFNYHPFSTPEIKENGYVGNLHSFLLPAGDYEFFLYHIEKGGKILVSPEWSGAFKVEAKEVVYLGRFLLTRTEDNRSKIAVEDQGAADFKMLAERVPFFKDRPYKTQMVQLP